ncbi:hypothetical protein BYT27DRAFT_6747978 [Phlegmacium glaucopus]|nr:hypothetical protein BYT27DRAFT_6747978 [Phlegmacium glaucopus]
MCLCTILSAFQLGRYLSTISISLLSSTSILLLLSWGIRLILPVPQNGFWIVRRNAQDPVRALRAIYVHLSLQFRYCY